jgi:hypothetical protein
MKKLILIFLYFFTGLTFGDTSVIINVDVNSGKLSTTDIRNIYLMRYNRWPNGDKVVLFQMTEDTYLFRHFVRDILGMSVEEYNKKWNKMVNSGLGSEVRYVKTTDEMLRRVSSTRSAIGYIDSDNVIINFGGNDVKVLHIAD